MFRGDIGRELFHRDDDCPVIIVDASVPLKEQRLLPYQIPGWAFVRSLLRIVNIQHVNTVDPRIEPMEDRRRRRVIKELSIVFDLPESLEFGRENALNLPLELPIRITEVPDGVISSLEAEQSYIRTLTAGGYLKDQGRLSAIQLPGRFPPELLDLGRRPVHKIGTHLARVQSADAVALLARGYLNTFLWTIELKPYETEEIERLETVAGRLLKMVEVRRESEVGEPK